MEATTISTTSTAALSLQVGQPNLSTRTRHNLDLMRANHLEVRNYLRLRGNPHRLRSMITQTKSRKMTCLKPASNTHTTNKSSTIIIATKLTVTRRTSRTTDDQETKDSQSQMVPQIVTITETHRKMKDTQTSHMTLKNLRKINQSRTVSQKLLSLTLRNQITTSKITGRRSTKIVM
jgi:hypothetical protein